MSQQRFTTRLGRSLVSATIGAICGGMLVSFGSVISSSTPVVVAMIVGGALLGGRLGRLGGAVNGAIIAGMSTAVGTVIGGSVIGVVCAMSGCALLGGWLRWRSQERWNDSVTPQSLPSPQKNRQEAEFTYCTPGTGTRHSLAAAVAADDRWLRWDGFQASRICL